MEGPSLLLAAELLQPFVGKKIEVVSGNTKIGKERLLGKKVLSIFSHGKHLYFQFDTFALRIHFMLFGSFQAEVNWKKVTGDYPKKERPTRLSFQFKNGSIDTYSCSPKFIEEAHAIDLCDFSIDIMSNDWDEKKAYSKSKAMPEIELGDLLLDQEVFLGVGNIIKNESCHLVSLSPETKVKDITPAKLKKLIQVVRKYVFQFYEWRKVFELRKHYQVYRQKLCKRCSSKVIKKKTGARARVSFICAKCQCGSL